MKRSLLQLEQGMTMLEMMLAVLLFAVFMGVFLAVTELTAQLVRGVEGGRPASELALARTLTRQQLTALVANSAAWMLLRQISLIVGTGGCLWMPIQR